MYKLLLVILFWQVAYASRSQSTSIDIKKNKWITIDSSFTYANSIDSFKNKKPFFSWNSINGKNYSKVHKLYLRIYNKANTPDSAYVFLGHWLNFSVRRIKNNYAFVQRTEKVALSVNNNEVPMLKVLLSANDSVTYEFIPEIKNYNFNYVKPYLVNINAVNDFGYFYYFNHQKTYLIISFIFIGILVGMFLYAFISWNRVRTKEFLFYGLYVLFFIVYFFIRIYTMFANDESILKHNYYAIHFTQVVGYILYAFFLFTFLHLKKESPKLYKALNVYNALMLAYLIADIYLIYFSKYIYISIFLFTLIRYLLLGISLVAVYYLFAKKDRLANYVASGILMLFVFGLISLFFSSLSFNKAHFMNFFDVRIPLYQIGITIELVLFTMALQYKTNIRNKERVMEMETLRVENEKKEFETFMAIINAKDKERTRIAQEIHDDIGSGLTNIRLLSEIAKTKNKDMSSTEIDKISSSASELIENMNEIIWSINSKNDNLSNLVAYLRRYVVTYFENYEDIVVKTNMPSIIPNVQISGDFRRSTFLVVKESLHNIIKHAKASQVDLFISITMQILHISITDNGIGFDQKNIKQFSNGLKNMRDRIEGLGGNFALLSSNGSKIIINLPL